MSVVPHSARSAHVLAEAVLDTLRANEAEILTRWTEAQRTALGERSNLLRPDRLTQRASEFFAVFLAASNQDDGDLLNGPAWGPVRRTLEVMSREHAEQGLQPFETAQCVFALKGALGDVLQRHSPGDSAAFRAHFTAATGVLDTLGLYSIEAFTRSREAIILQQARDLLEISCPCIRLWDGILALPIIGVLDSRRSQQIMETLLCTVVETRSRVVILDITGVPTVDTLTAAHLIKSVQAVKLLGARAIITGISGRIAQTLVGLGLDLGGINTKSIMADGVADAFNRLGLRVVSEGNRPAQAQER